MVRISKPVASGSSVPQWPTFLMSSLRLTIATTSCDVMPSALSTSRTPSGVAVKDMGNFRQHFAFDFGERAADPRTGGKFVTAAAEFCRDRADVGPIVFRSHADAHFAVAELLEKCGNNHAADGADMIDETFVIFRQYAEIGGGLHAQTKTRDAIGAFEMQCA